MRILIIAVISLFGLQGLVFAQSDDQLAQAVKTFNDVRSAGNIRDVKDAAVAMNELFETSEATQEAQIILYETSVLFTNRGDYFDETLSMIATLESSPERLDYIQVPHLNLMRSLIDWNEDPKLKTRKAVGKQIKAVRKLPPNAAIHTMLLTFVKEDDENDKLRIRIREDAAKVFEGYKQTFPNEWAELAYLAYFAKALRSGNSKWTKSVAEIEAFLGHGLLSNAEIDGETEDLYLMIKQGRINLQEYFSGNRVTYNSTTTRRGSFERGVPAESIAKIFASYDYDPDAVQALLDE